MRFPEHRVLVLGDLILDRYVWGNTNRISPEAPVPVVYVERESTMLGGAGNVARNLASLGTQVEVVGVAGDDTAAVDMMLLFERWKIDAAGLMLEPDRPTTEKTRVIARGQQVVRYDRETEEPVSPEGRAGLLRALHAAAGRVQGAIVQDYGKGLLTTEVNREAMRTLAEARVRVFVDPKQVPLESYAGAELIKPNLAEAESFAGMRVRDVADLERLGETLLTRCGGSTLAVTRGGQGMTLFSPGHAPNHVSTTSRAVSDVAGAGDTAIATLTLARLSGASWTEAAQLANAAAGVVVGVTGTATITPAELLHAAEGLA
jgi:D-beta-D-heptose 7-phosphate kinase/D-beta-D-heptose 1-phosphate adenosyltransferase